MKCPACSHTKHSVVRSKPGLLNTTKRRRLCSHCGARWTTTELVELSSIVQDAEPEFTNKKLLERWRKEIVR